MTDNGIRTVNLAARPLVEVLGNADIGGGKLATAKSSMLSLAGALAPYLTGSGGGVDTTLLQTEIDALSSTVADLQSDASITALRKLVGRVARWRPGYTPINFTASLTDTPENVAELDSSLIVDSSIGKAYQLTGAGIVAQRDPIWVEPSRVKAFRTSFRRVSDPTDPAGDNVRVLVQWLDAGYGAISQTVVKDTTLTATMGMQTVSGRIPSQTGDPVAITPPTNTVFARIAVQTYGSDGVTNVIDIASEDVTDAAAYSPDLTATNARVTALESEVAAISPLAAGAANGLATLDANGDLVQIPKPLRGIARSDITTARIPAPIITFRTSDGAQYKRGADGTGPGAKQDVSGQWWWIDVSGEEVEARWFDDGATDKAGMIVAAIAACPAGGIVRLPPGNVNIVGSGTEAILITKSVHIIGAGFGYSSALSGILGTVLTGTLPSTRDLFRILPASGEVLRGIRISGFAVNITGGQDWVHLDTRASTTSELAEVEIDHCNFLTASTRHGINFDNRSDNLNGGMFNCDVHHCFINSVALKCCISGSYAGDTIRVYDNILTGAGWAVNFAQIVYGGVGAGGGGQLLVDGNNITAFCGIKMGSGIRPVISNNEIEIAGDNPTGAIVNLAGDVGIIDGATIVNNQIQLIPKAGGGNPVGVGEFISIGNCQGAVISNNRFGLGFSAPTIYAVAVGASNGVDTRIGPNNTFFGIDAAHRVYDFGTKTQSAVPITTWIPVIAGDTTAGTPTYSFRSGWFTVWEGLVTFGFNVVCTSLDSAATNLRLTGLSAAGVTGLPGGADVAAENAEVTIVQYVTASAPGPLSGVIMAGNNYANLLTNAAVASAFLSATQAGASFLIVGRGSYRIY